MKDKKDYMSYLVDRKTIEEVEYEYEFDTKGNRVVKKFTRTITTATPIGTVPLEDEEASTGTE